MADKQKRSSEYWKKRFDLIEQSANNMSTTHVRKLEKKYKVAAQELDKQINSWYQRLANNNEVSITEARKLLTTSELKEFKWNVKEYIQYGQENAVNQAWVKELENASAKFHINRLEALKLECRQQVEKVFAGGQEAMYDTLANVYKDTFYHSCFEIQKGTGVGFDVSALDDKQVSKILNKPWATDGSNFSQRIWNNRTKLVNTLDQELSRMVLTGESPKNAVANIQKALNTSKYNAARLVMTEQAYFTSLAQSDCYKELDVEEYEIVATLDNRTTEICQQMDGKHFPVKDMMAGVNAPPFHVWCRTTTCPYFNDEFSGGERAASDEDGNIYYVPANMTYSEWYEKYVENFHQSDIIKLPDIKVNKSVGAKTKNYDVVDPNTGDVFHFVEGTRIQNAEVFAGKGTRNSLHDGVAEGLSEQIGGKPENWQHCKGSGVLDYFGEERPAEVHWFQEETVGKVKFKVKRWKDEG